MRGILDPYALDCKDRGKIRPFVTGREQRIRNWPETFVKVSESKQSCAFQQNCKPCREHMQSSPGKDVNFPTEGSKQQGSFVFQKTATERNLVVMEWSPHRKCITGKWSVCNQHISSTSGLFSESCLSDSDGANIIQ